MMSRFFYVLPLLAIGIPTVLGINTYIGSDGKSRYTTALQCQSASLYFSFYYNLVRTDYSTRNDMDCCYLAETRNLCCIGYTESGSQETECRCNKSITCGAERILPSTTMSTSTTSSTTTTTVPSTTTATTTTPSTTTSSTTTSTTTTPTTTTPSTTTTTETTTAPFRSLCSQARALNGELVSDTCVYSGIANLHGTQTPEQVTCNAVYTTAVVNGELKETFVTLTFCTNTIKVLYDFDGTIFDLNIGTQTFPVVEPLMTHVDGEDGISFIEINPVYARITSNIGCQVSSCAYNEATMLSVVDFNDCLMVSYGSSDAVTTSQNGLNEVAVKLDPNGCGDVQDMFGANNTMCFTSVSGSNLFCANDGGAPVYCRAPSNNELILMGVTAFQSSCDLTPDIKVIPIPN